MTLQLDLDVYVSNPGQVTDVCFIIFSAKQTHEPSGQLHLVDLEFVLIGKESCHIIGGHDVVVQVISEAFPVLLHDGPEFAEKGFLFRRQLIILLDLPCRDHMIFLSCVVRL